MGSPKALQAIIKFYNIKSNCGATAENTEGTEGIKSHIRQL